MAQGGTADRELSDGFAGSGFLVTTFKTFQTSSRVHQLLFPSEKGMALRTNLHANLLLCGTRDKNFTAGTGNFCLLINRMNSFFHNKLRKRLYKYKLPEEKVKSEGPRPRRQWTSTRETPCCSWFFPFF